MNSLDDVRALIDRLCADLDPRSRYRPELLAIVEASVDVADLQARLRRSCRGLRHAGAEIFEQMTLEQQIRCNLVTNETVLFRFSEGEWELLHGRILPRFAALRNSAHGRILCAPCSHGEEAFSLAAACLQANVPFSIDAFDIQQACITAARRGRLSLGFPDRYLQQPAIISRDVLDRIRFEVADLLAVAPDPAALPEARYDLVVCRNFLGYFVEPVALQVVHRLADRLAPGGTLLLDSFCISKHPGLAAALIARGCANDGQHAIFTAPDEHGRA